ncbi:hypothetical protein F6X54_10650 [Micromonospora aurantiaca]|uniref:Uncharacterized protein n=1 Tax=Micromonospora aurantiaca (nom. illeg.) TaxID=47850 RepID=A0ABQ6UIN7_9ACTN|nr:hypothetical protein [Micromonospora aurantiaca]KAB1116734.1 hypothetical protein F6X54_10650 [Micromonospora aurantiaca]
MIDTAILTAGLTGVAALSGVLVSVLADGLKDRRRTAHERALREEDRRAAASDRRRTFELENLISAYDGLWLLAREAAKAHQADVYAAKNTEHGYGGTLLPAGTEVDLSQTSQAVKSIRLILNDDVRRLALDARDAMTAVSMLGLRAKIFQTGPVSLAEGEAAMADATQDRRRDGGDLRADTDIDGTALTLAYWPESRCGPRSTAWRRITGGQGGPDPRSGSLSRP